MKNRTVEIVLVVTAGVLFAWGLANSIDRGDSPATEWTCYVLAGLVVVTAANIALRSTMLSRITIGLSALMVLAVLVAAFGPNPLPTFAVVRSLTFFAA